MKKTFTVHVRRTFQRVDEFEVEAENQHEAEILYMDSNEIREGRMDHQGDQVLYTTQVD